MALYPVGKNKEGIKSLNAENLKTKSLYQFTENYKIGKKFTIKSERYILPETFSLNLVQTEFNVKNWQLGNILIFQKAIKSKIELSEN